MKRLIIPLALLLSACGFDDIQVSGEVEFIDTRVKQVGSQFYVGLFAGDEILACLPVDPGTIYPDKWVTLEEAAEARMSPVSNFELVNCL